MTNWVGGYWDGPLGSTGSMDHRIIDNFADNENDEMIETLHTPFLQPTKKRNSHFLFLLRHGHGHGLDKDNKESNEVTER